MGINMLVFLEGRKRGFFVRFGGLYVSISIICSFRMYNFTILRSTFSNTCPSLSGLDHPHNKKRKYTYNFKFIVTHLNEINNTNKILI